MKGGTRKINFKTKHNLWDYKVKKVRQPKFRIHKKKGKKYRQGFWMLRLYDSFFIKAFPRVLLFSNYLKIKSLCMYKTKYFYFLKSLPL